MNRNTLGGEAFDGREPVDPLAPVTRGLEFVKAHHRFWLHDEDGSVAPEAPDMLSQVVDRLVILEDLPEHVEVDPDLRASVHQYPPIRSEVPLTILGDVVEQIRAYGQPNNTA